VSNRLSLVEVLDRVIDRGAVLEADALIGLADVDLIRIALQLVVVPADRLPQTDQPAEYGHGRSEPAGRAQPVAGGPAPPVPRHPATPSTPPAAELDRRSAERGLVQLVLTVVELLRDLMERQAVRRAMRGTVSDEQAERLGLALIELDRRMDELAALFDLDRQDLNLDLGFQ
jgi:hypothetical protein